MFKNPFSFEGRIARKEYALSYLIYIAAVFLILMFIGMLVEVGGDALASVGMIGFFPLAWFNYAQGAKRCHDVGHSGFFQLIPFYVLWMLFGPSEEGPNKYGADPMNPTAEYSTVSDNDVLDDMIYND